MNKFDRIQRVKYLGLNTENCILVTRKNELVDNPFLEQFTQFSIRTFWADGDEIRKTPHSAVICKKDLYKTGCSLLKQGLHLIIKDCINPKDAIFAGAALKTCNEIIIEIANGPVTVRTVTHDNNIDERYTYNLKTRKLHTEFYNKSIIFQSERIFNCIEQFKTIKEINIIFEFSYYKKQIGWKNESFICWEITPSGHIIEPLYNGLLWERYNNG